jgi:hypothetical protein
LISTAFTIVIFSVRDFSNRHLKAVAINNGIAKCFPSARFSSHITRELRQRGGNLLGQNQFHLCIQLLSWRAHSATDRPISPLASRNRCIDRLNSENR